MQSADQPWLDSRAEVRLSEPLAAVELGEEITITRYGRPIARIVAMADAPAAAVTQRERVAGIFVRLREMRQGRALGGSLREAIEDGRD